MRIDILRCGNRNRVLSWEGASQMKQTKEEIKIAVFKKAAILEEKEEYRNYYRRRYETAVQKYEKRKGVN